MRNMFQANNASFAVQSLGAAVSTRKVSSFYLSDFHSSLSCACMTWPICPGAGLLTWTLRYCDEEMCRLYGRQPQYLHPYHAPTACGSCCCRSGNDCSQLINYINPSFFSQRLLTRLLRQPIVHLDDVTWLKHVTLTKNARRCSSSRLFVGRGRLSLGLAVKLATCMLPCAWFQKLPRQFGHVDEFEQIRNK